MIDRNMAQRIARENLLFRYANALERGDVKAVSSVLQEAENDAVLERMILEVNAVYVAELQSGQINLPSNHRGKILNISSFPSRRSHKPSVALAVAAMIVVLFSAVLIYSASTDSPFNVAGLFQSENSSHMDTFMRYMEEAWNQGNVAMLPEVLTADHVRHDNAADLTGIDAIATLISSYHTAMPDLHFDIQDITADGDRVWAYLIGSGTQTGSLVLPDGTIIPASDARVTLLAMTIARFVDGKIAEMWVEYDNLQPMQEMGVVPSAQQRSTEAQNLTVAQRVIDELWRGGNVRSISELYANPFTWHTPLYDDPRLKSPGSWQGYVTWLVSGFPDMRLTINEMTAAEDRVIVRYTFQGTHESYVPGLNHPEVTLLPTGRMVTWDGIFIYRFQDSKIVEEWWYWNNEYMTRAEYEQSN